MAQLGKSFLPFIINELKAIRDELSYDKIGAKESLDSLIEELEEDY